MLLLTYIYNYRVIYNYKIKHYVREKNIMQNNQRWKPLDWLYT